LIFQNEQPHYLLVLFWLRFCKARIRPYSPTEVSMKKTALISLFSIWLAVCLLLSAWGNSAPALQAVTIYSTNFNSGYVLSRTFI